MKKISLLFTFLFLSTFMLKAQEAYATFKQADKTYQAEVAIDEETGERKSVYIQTDDGSSKAYIYFKTPEEFNAFKSFVNTTFSKYREWVDKAKENNITELRKDIDSKLLGSGYAFKYGSWHYSFRPVKVTALIKISVDDNGQTDYAYILLFPKVTAYDNEYIDSEVTILYFDQSTIGVRDTKMFLKVLDNTLIDKFVEDKKKKADLFY